MTIEEAREYLKPDEINVVIYHNPCSDGFGGRWVAERYLRKNAVGNVYYISANYGEEPYEHVEGANVLIIDFSYDANVIKEMLTKVNKLLILDHHASAERKLVDFPDNSYFDMTHSGAWLAWKYFYPDDEVPKLIEYIQDRDLWTNKLPGTEAFSLYFQTFVPFKFESYEEYFDDKDVEKAIELGKPMISYRDQMVKQLAGNAKLIETKTNEGKKITYYLVNCNAFISELGNYLSQKADFAVIWFCNNFKDNNVLQVKLRSDNRFDVSRFADQFGGGGHPNASGYNLTGYTIEGMERSLLTTVQNFGTQFKK